MYTNQTRITGLSGIDTESMIKKLMEAESVRLTSLQKNKQKLVWRQESYRAASDSLKTFQNSMLNLQSAGNIRLPSTFASMSTSVKLNGTDSSAISVSAGSNAAAGNHKLQVIQLAQADAAKSTSAVKGAISFDSANADEIMENGFSVQLSLDGAKTKTIEVTAAEVQRYLDTQNITDATEDDILNASAEVLNSNLAATFGSDTNAAFDGTYGQKVNASFEDGAIRITAGKGHNVKNIAYDDTVANALGAAAGTSTSLDVNMKMSDIFGGGVNGQKFTINNVSFTVDGDESLSAFMKRINESGAGVNLSYDTQSFEFKLENTQAGSANVLSFADAEGNNFLGDKLKLDMGQKTGAKDAIVSFNGKVVSRESNNFEIDGIKFNLTNAVNPGDTFDITISKNTAGALDSVKKFVEEYNKLIDALNAQYKTQRPKSSGAYYEPLSDTDKEAMSEKQIEDWEKNAKVGLNYNDSLLSSIAREMRSMMYENVKLSDGTTINLTQIGITTDGATNDGKLVIDEAKFKEAYEKRPDDVAALFTKSSSISITDKSNRNARLKDEGLGDRLNDIINSAIDSSGSLRAKAGMVNTASALNNDMYNQIKAQEDKISNMLRTLQAKEENYYLMFSKLEAAITSSDSQMSYLQSMLGL